MLGLRGLVVRVEGLGFRDQGSGFLSMISGSKRNAGSSLGLGSHLSR